MTTNYTWDQKLLLELLIMFSPTRKLYNSEGEDLQWDYPDYGGLPARIYNTFSPKAVDAMQDVIQDRFKRKRDFARAYRDRLKDLGEPGNYGKGIK